nr:hypothetical protein [Tanacetum cinerariifolium]
MAAPTIPDSAEENLGDSIEIRVDVVHPALIAAVAFLTTIVEEVLALRFWVEVAEAAKASLRATIRTMEAIETVTNNHERLAYIEIERHLALVQESHRQDREDFKKLKELVTS